MENTHALQLLRNRYAQMPMPDEVLTRLIDIGAKLGLCPLNGEVFASVYQSATTTRQYFDVTLAALRVYGQRKGVRGASLEWLADDGATYRAWVKTVPPAACVATVTPTEAVGLPRAGVARLDVARRYTIGPSGQPEPDVVWMLRAAERLAEAAEREALLALFPEVEAALQPLAQQPYHGPQTLSATEAEIMKRGGGAGAAGTGTMGTTIPVPPPVQRSHAEQPASPSGTGSEGAAAVPPPPVQRPSVATPPPAQRPPVPPVQPQAPAAVAPAHGRRPLLPPPSSGEGGGESNGAYQQPGSAGSQNGSHGGGGNGHRPPAPPPGDDQPFF